MTSPSDVASRGMPAQLETMRLRVAEMCDSLLAGRGVDELADTVAAVEAVKATLDALELRVLAELAATRALEPLGWASTKDFCTSVSGGTRSQGAATLHLAEELTRDRFAPVAEALRDGWLSTAKAHVITRAVLALPVTADHARGVAVLLDEAKRLDAGDLRRVGRHLLTVIDPDGEDRREERAMSREERAAHLQRRFTISPDEMGGAWLRGRCSIEDAALIKATLMPLAAPQPGHGCLAEDCRTASCGHEADGRDVRDHGARMLDALVELCRRAQTARVLPDDHGAPSRVTLLMRLQDLVADRGFAMTDMGEDVDAGTARRMSCDAEVIPVVLGEASEVLDVGRAARLVTPAIWRALVARDRHCRFPGCTRPPLMCHAHHVVHWVDGGPTSLTNMLLLCGHHHRLVHSGPWRVVLGPGPSAVFTPPPATTRRVPGQPVRPPPRE